MLVRKDERASVSRVASKDGVSYGYSYEALGADKKDRKMEPFIVTLDPETLKKAGQSTHDGEEFIFVLDGQMEVTLGDHSDVLLAGDSIYYDSTIPHRVGAKGSAPAKILAVLFTGAK